MEIICPYCKSGVGSGSDVIRCLECGTRHHWVCWMEHGNHCSVFSCKGNLIKIRIRKKSDTWLLLWCVINYSIHLGLQWVGIVGNSLRVSDDAMIVSLEIFMVATGILVLRNRLTSDIARSFGALLFSSNALFLLFLFGELISHGPQGLNALIRL